MSYVALIALNAHHDLVEFALPMAAGDGAWNLLLDTNVALITPNYRGNPGDRYDVAGRSLVLFVLTPP